MEYDNEHEMHFARSGSGTRQHRGSRARQCPGRQCANGRTGVEHLDLFDSAHALVFRRPNGEKGPANLETLPLP